MTLDQLRIFLEVATRQHVTEASRCLNLTQSAVSAALATLEARHGVALFDRIGRGIRLNEAGRSFIPWARDVLKAAEAAEQALEDLRSGEGGILRVSASQTVSGYFLADYLMRYRQKHPKVDLSLRHGNTAMVVQDLRDGEADLGLVEGQVSAEDLRRTPLAEDHLVILVGAGHPWAAGHPLSAKDLLDAAWVLREPGSGTRAMFDHVAAGWLPAGGAPQIMLQLPSNEACIAALRTNTAATFLSRLAAEPHLAGAGIRLANYPSVRRDFSLLSHQPRLLSRSARNFCEVLLGRPV